MLGTRGGFARCLPGPPHRRPLAEHAMDVDLQACINGDKRAWDLFVERYAGLIVAAVGRSIRGQAARRDLEDPVQEVFVRLIKDDYRLLRSYDPNRSSLSTWLTMVARSVAIDQVRRSRLPTVPLEPQEVAEAPPASAEPATTVPVHLLTARQRLVLRMLFDEGRSVGETARIIGVSEQTIRSTKHKALSRLREQLSAGS